MPKLTHRPRSPIRKNPSSKPRPAPATPTSTCSGRRRNIRSRPTAPTPAHDALPETLFALQDKLGLSTAVIVSPGGYGRNYAMLADVLAKYPDRFRGIALVRDDIPTAELARLTRLGVRGMRMMSAKRGQHVPNYSTARSPRACTSTAGTSSSIRTAPTSSNTPTSCWR